MSSKLDARTRQMLAAAGERPDEAAPDVSIFVRCTHELSDDDVARLAAVGARVRTVAGDVATASVPLAAVHEVATLEFVTAVQASEPLYPEGSDPAASFDVE
jgi:hypothetical protein